MKNVVLGTAGHIDHGKTTLIKALTGIETDTSKEEKQRGLSINLGFAYIDLNNGERVGIVDVPGHEKFIKNMLAGAAGIDLVMLVIDVNEGIMPQTKEHVSVLNLLGIEDFIIVLTKVADVDEDLKLLVYEDIREQFEGTPLEKAPIIETDAMTGIGIEDLKALLVQKVENIQRNNESLPARLNVDRAFSVKGFGTVVTGTLIDGSIKVGDDLTIYPAGIPTRIRTIQIHEQDQEIAHAGNRTALNLTKVDLDQIGRGDVLSAAPLESSYMLDTKVQCLKDANQAMELWDRVHVHIGTREVIGRLVPLGIEKVQPGQTAFMQIRLEEQIAVKKGDRFILRNYSPVTTIGGGEVLDPTPKKHKRYNQDVIDSLEVLESGTMSDVLLDFLANRSAGFTSIKEMADYLNEEMRTIEGYVKEMVDAGDLIKFGQFYMAKVSFEAIQREMEEMLKEFHRINNMIAGMSLEEFRSRFNKITPKELNAIIQSIVSQGQFVIEGDLIRLASHSIAISPAQAKARKAIEEKLAENPFAPPLFEEVVGKDKTMREVYMLMRKQNEFYRLDKQTEIHISYYNEALRRLKDFFQDKDTIALADFRNLLGTSRKYALLLLEDFDKRGITKRDGDVRVINPKYLQKIEEAFM
ncbi:selenocysteine-specific translation elongation factor [Facklamia miroungae]|uniref:Selenocysteine-specific elongation factor n=1 Tax=Facklamia miroungae TaxID=120956 RepID=A0A1G7QQY4_9LACT|nr:selenocysteine-specific translation elongation factor [Facklamia miroungae]NKZ29032.1 selenocysteine-specific translation elongation factor [Facklamia miroungae]SDG00893.1 selenocysteine-specific elongation factor [Facklamia miroungae]